MIKQGRRGEWKPGNTGGESGREGARGKGGRREAGALKGWKGRELVGNYSTMLIILLSKRRKEKETNHSPS